MKESLSLRFLYHTVPGRWVLRLLICPGISKCVGAFLNTKASRCLIPGFMKRNHISLEGIVVPEKGFASFNSFFYRERLEVVFDEDPAHLCSPCDAWLSVGRLEKGTVLNIKHTRFSAAELLKDEKLAEEFQNGLALVFRLTPSHYHRYSYPCDVTVEDSRRIEGKLHCVRPIATEMFPVFAQNAREYEVLQAPDWGKLVQMEVGAMFVGRITNHPHTDKAQIRKGTEKGYFEFGGSTIIVLCKDPAIVLREEILACANGDGEIPVRTGEWIAYRKE